jgi:hypothetical protein
MSFIARELERLAEALRNPQNASAHERLYAAQQALAWANEPNGFRSPFAMIMGTRASSEDCSDARHPTPFSDTCSRTD